LKLAKDQEITATTASLSQLKAYYRDCSNISESDFINVLYNSNFSFKQTFDQILPDGTKKPSSKDIDKSYAKFFVCENIMGSATADQISALNNTINNIYYDGYSNVYSITTLNQANF